MQIIHWFRRDLRLHDNPALAAALQAAQGQVIPLFIFDDAILKSPRVGPARIQFLIESLDALNAALQEHGSGLIVRHGEPARVLRELAHEADATAVYFNRDYTPFARSRDQRVSAELTAQMITVQTFADLIIWEPDTIQTQTGKPYTVYTPYRKQWRARIDADPRLIRETTPLAPFAPLAEDLKRGALPRAQELGHTPQQQAVPGGEAEGLQRLDAFVKLANDHGIRDYDTQRDLMAQPATSRLSAYLHLGCVSTRASLRAALQSLDNADADARGGIESWIGEIAWHDFYMQILWHFPHVLRSAFKPIFNDVQWTNNEQQFQAWCAGQTGYPIVDAAMRQLNSEAWMHNRARMIVASFLVKDLLIDWRWGERYFLQQLVDGDHAANNGGWQWVAGTGTDAQPYFRIFNPISQGKKFDQRGTYIRRYLPELAGLPDLWIHAPWTAPEAELRQAGVTLGETYPAPIVDHKVQREKALAMYSRVRSTA